ncbi:MAG TPA: class I SAM-dependent methyltransferase [Mycobacteriales bacterium]
MSWFEQAPWEERYRGTTAVWSGRPNHWLVAEAAGLRPGTALDAGSGEGGDSLWLAGRGWQVTAVDFAGAALERGARAAEAAGLADRVDWVRADLRTWTPPGSYDLVSVQFLHPAAEARKAVLGRLAGAVAPGGTLLVVGHDIGEGAGPGAGHGHDAGPGAGHGGGAEHGGHAPGVYPSAAELAADLEPAAWEIVAAEQRQRPATGHEAEHGTILSDAVLVARRRA